MLVFKKIFLCLGLIFLTACKNETKVTQEHIQITKESSYYQGKSLKVAVIGLTHTHVHWILGREKWGDIEIVGIVESNRDLAEAV